MIRLVQNWRPSPAPAFYKKEPGSSELGKRIVREGLALMLEIGFDAFTFKKLAERMQTTEASVYRYFENKHHILLYFMSMYWIWIEYQLTFGVENLADPSEKLFRAIRMIARPEALHWPVDEAEFHQLHQLVVAEWGRVYYSSAIDAEHQAGLFADYTRVCKRLSEMIIEVQPGYPYPSTLVSAVMNILFVQRYYAVHLPSLTELCEQDERITDFTLNLVKGALKTS
jgi:AcrR family transcriptional regulator